MTTLVGLEPWTRVLTCPPPDRSAAMRVLRRRGLSYRAIGERFGCTEHVVARLLMPRLAEARREQKREERRSRR